jgi:ABC-type lipoprotein export system ATPase subunit
MAGASVRVEGISRRFRLGSEDVWAVKEVTLAIEPGEFVALIGRSGSGKTTLLNLMAGLDKPTEGQVFIDGARVDTMHEKELNQLRRHKLGFIFQSFGLLPLLSAQENIELPLRIAGYRHGERVRRARRVLEMVGLGRRADHRPYELSGGEQQRVAIARALATEPSLMLADEPTGELDSATATVIFGLLRDVARSEGITIVTCTHDRLVMEMAGRVEELSDGRLVTGQTHEVWSHVRQKDRSVFASPGAAPVAGQASAGLSSLIGADTSLFRPLDATENGLDREGDFERESDFEPGTATSHSPPVPQQEEPDEDPSVWARRGGR